MAYPDDNSTGDQLPAADINLIKKRVTLPAQTAGEAMTGATTPQPVFLQVSDAKWYLCDGNNTSRQRFDGFAINSPSGDGQSVDLVTEGLLSGFTGLTAGAFYYVSDTVGTIATTAGTNKIPVGIAASTTELMIFKKDKIRSGTGTDQTENTTTTNDETLTVGFRPRLIIITARLGAQTLNNNPNDASSSQLATIHFIGTTGVLGMGISQTINAGSTDIPFNPDDALQVMTSFSITNSYSGTFNTQLTINAISDTGFTIRGSFTDTSATSPNGTIDNIKWVAFE